MVSRITLDIQVETSGGQICLRPKRFSRIDVTERNVELEKTKSQPAELLRRAGKPLFCFLTQRAISGDATT